MGTLQGVYLPIITPFQDDEIDEETYRNLIEQYLLTGISGLIPLGTTGESPTLSNDETERMTELTVSAVNGRLPVYVGVGGNCTKKVLQLLTRVERYAIQGILSVCPYYNRPSQRGIYEHFLRISEATNLSIIIYNIPYRTGVNLENETLLKLAEQRNIIGVKDSCGNLKQTAELIGQKPDGFSVLTGEDALFYTTVTHGGDGGILAAAHLRTAEFVEIFRLLQANDYQAALPRWQALSRFIPLLFQEPNPTPLKYVLHRLGLIPSHETRLPLVEISSELQRRLDNLIDSLA
ncbi:dihydrodipicolinate synthase [Candidatus Moduliflexus flocculans]|uniref:4-hydroxy-tetrahydrodipicolinate synthase n=1 Tax=Candidatus Moduliflexus flocculans TaxID=1499966 RepID=A0A0S6VSD8_9BACT|nr:dihydrodipicolinate synthase [Candidatus Moduliflexus flocculans]